MTALSAALRCAACTNLLHFQAICSGGGDVLNVGFGLGLVDMAIQSKNPRSHTIIEAHPDVLRKVSHTNPLAVYALHTFCMTLQVWSCCSYMLWF